MKIVKEKLIIICSFVALFLTVVLSLRFGSSQMSATEFWNGLTLCDEVNSVIIYKLRLPRIVAGLLSGVGLAVSGSILQRVTDNDMASPHVVGVNTGAGFFVICALAFFTVNVYYLPLFAFLGAIFSTVVIVVLSYKNNANKYTLVLIGLAINALFSAGISLVSILEVDVLTDYHIFSVGTIEGVRWTELLLPSIVIILSFLVAFCFGKNFNSLALGDSLAISLGTNVKKTKIVGVILASASAGAVVSFAGLLGFVGLITPHIAKKLFGANFKKVLPVSCLFGALLVTLADFVGKILFAPSELPVGIFMAFIGVPFFIALLVKGGKKNA